MSAQTVLGMLESIRCELDVASRKRWHRKEIEALARLRTAREVAKHVRGFISNEVGVFAVDCSYYEPQGTSRFTVKQLGGQYVIVVRQSLASGGAAWHVIDDGKHLSVDDGTPWIDACTEYIRRGSDSGW